MYVWAAEMMVLVAGESVADAEREAERIAELYPGFPWLRGLSHEAWRRLPDNELLTIRNPTQPVTRTAKEWVRLRGPGLLAVPDKTTGCEGPLRGPDWLRTYKPPVQN
jgi:hypothetical protein